MSDFDDYDDYDNIQMEGEKKSQNGEFTIQNMSIKCNLNSKLDLFDMAQKIANAEYRPRQIAGLVIRINHPQATARIFKNGTMTVHGIKTKEDGVLAAQKFGKIIKRLHYRVHLSDIEVNNIIASNYYDFQVNFESLSQDPIYKKMIKYNPENFSGLTIKIPNKRIKINIFKTGYMSFSGSTNIDEFKESYDTVLKILKIHEQKPMDVSCFSQPQQVNDNMMPVNQEKTKRKNANDPFAGRKPRK